MAKIKKVVLDFDRPAVYTDIKEFNVYYCPASAGPITYDTPHILAARVGTQLTYTVRIPEDINIGSGNWLLGVASVSLNDSISDIATLAITLDFTVPLAPVNLRLRYVG